MIKTRWFLLLVCLVISLSFVPPVYAVLPATTSITEFFFTVNGIPADNTVDFTLDCYGKGKYPRLNYTYYDLTESRYEPTDTDPIDRFRAQCRPFEPCYVYKPDKPPVQFSTCDLSGTYKGKQFLLHNISWLSIRSTQHQVVCLRDCKERYAMRGSYWECSDQLYNDKIQCSKKFSKRNASTGYFQDTPDTKNCENAEKEKYSECIRKNGTWINSTNARNAAYYYEFRFDIATNTTINTTGNSTGYTSALSTKNNEPVPSPASEQRPHGTGADSAGTRKDPVESLYCSILRFFGVSC
jgi:hypothetical protein